METPKPIEIPKERTVNINSLRIDGKNPNVMSHSQKEALKKSIEKYGFLMPIITNEDLTIADGQHRWEAAKELGMLEIKIIQLPIADVDRMILRQVLNKLRGEHEKGLDIEEYRRIYEKKGLERMGELIPNMNISKVIDHIRVNKDGATPEKEKKKVTKNKCPKCDYEW